MGVGASPFPFALLHMQQAIKLACLYAALCMMGAVSFAFRG